MTKSEDFFLMFYCKKKFRTSYNFFRNIRQICQKIRKKVYSTGPRCFNFLLQEFSNLTAVRRFLAWNHLHLESKYFVALSAIQKVEQ